MDMFCSKAFTDGYVLSSALLMAFPRSSSLWSRLAIPFVAFVALGSSALMLWFHRAARQDALRMFATEARANAEFVRTTHLPMTTRTAEPLSRVLGMEVGFTPPSQSEINAPAISRPGFDSKTFSKQVLE